jgi:hypothetical protein
MNRFDMSKQEEEEFIKQEKKNIAVQNYAGDSETPNPLWNRYAGELSPQIEMAYRYAFSFGFHAGYEFGSEKTEETTINSVRAALHLSNWVREKGPQ